MRTFKKLARTGNERLKSLPSKSVSSENREVFSNYKRERKYNNQSNYDDPINRLESNSYRNNHKSPDASVKSGTCSCCSSSTYGPLMLCPDCINRDMAESKNRLNNEPVKVLGNFWNNREDERRINERIKNRQLLSQMAGNEVNNYKDGKIEDLQRKNENNKDKLFDLTKDYLKIRAKTRENNYNNLINKNIKSYKGDNDDKINNYYKNCVGEGNESLIKPRPSTYNKQDYYNYVQKQIDENEYNKRRNDIENEKEEKQLLRSRMNKLNEDYENQSNRKKMNQKNMDDTNKRLINLRAQKRNEERLKNLDEEQNIIDSWNKNNHRAQEEFERQKAELNRVYTDNYKRYLRNKQQEAMKELEEKENDRKLAGMNFHQDTMGTCDICHREIPAKNLTSYKIHRNKRKNY